MNVRTLKRRLRHYGLRRRNHLYSEHTVREIIKREIEGLLSLLVGYRGMWNKLRTTYHVTVPRDTVMKILRELDPDPTQSGMSMARDKTFFFDFQNIFVDFMTILGL